MISLQHRSAGERLAPPLAWALALLVSCQAPGEGDKLGPNGWPLGDDGAEKIPEFASTVFAECRPAERGGGVDIWFTSPLLKFSARVTLSCDRLGAFNKELSDVVRARFGEGSVDAFRGGDPKGMSVGTRPADARAGADDIAAVEKPARLRDDPERRVPKIGVELLGPRSGEGTFGFYYSEEGANYLLLWLEDLFRRCCT